MQAAMAHLKRNKGNLGSKFGTPIVKTCQKIKENYNKTELLMLWAMTEIKLIIINEDPLSGNYFIRTLFVILLISCQANCNDREVLFK